MLLTPRLRLAHVWLLLLAVAGSLVFALAPPVSTASAATAAKSKKSKKSASKKSSSKKNKKGKSKKKASTPKAVDKGAKPQLRPAQAPVSVSDLWSGESSGMDGGEPGEAPLPAADDLDAIAAQYQIEIATGQVELAPEVLEESGVTAEPEAEPEEVDDTPKWIKHTIVPHVPLDAIAARYGVSKKSILRWNKMDPKKVYLRAGKTLKIKAVRPPPPREKIEYEIKKGDTWDKIAAAHGVDAKLLKKWNQPPKKNGKRPQPKLIAGKSLHIWVEAALAGGDTPELGDSPGPASSGSSAADREAKRLIAKVRRNAFSIGKPTKGRVVNGVSPPEGTDLYVLRKPAQAYGSSHTVRTMIGAMSTFRQRSGYKKPLVIGAISLPKGGRFRPHRSHQSGRDIDIRLPVRASVDHNTAPRANEVDWKAAWRLIKAFVDTGTIRYIFLDHRLQKILHKAALASGATKKEVAEIIQWPRPKKSNNGIVRHAAGHTSHIHVRIMCGPQETRCISVR